MTPLPAPRRFIIAAGIVIVCLGVGMEFLRANGVRAPGALQVVIPGMIAITALLSWRYRSAALRRLIPGDASAPLVNDPGAFVRWCWTAGAIIATGGLLRWALDFM